LLLHVLLITNVRTIDVMIDYPIFSG